MHTVIQDQKHTFQFFHNDHLTLDALMAALPMLLQGTDGVSNSVYWIPKHYLSDVQNVCDVFFNTCPKSSDSDEDALNYPLVIFDSDTDYIMVAHVFENVNSDASQHKSIEQLHEQLNEWAKVMVRAGQEANDYQTSEFVAAALWKQSRSLVRKHATSDDIEEYFEDFDMDDFLHSFHDKNVLFAFAKYHSMIAREYDEVPDVYSDIFGI